MIVADGRRCWALVGVALAVSLGGACGGDSGAGGDEVVAPDAYVGKVCQAAVQWNKEVGVAFNDSEWSKSDDSSESIRRGMLGLYDDSRSATYDLRARIDDAGIPDVPDGGAVVRELRASLTAAATRIDAIREEFADIPLTDIQPAASIEGSLTAFAEKTDSVNAAVARLGETSPLLRQARERDPACIEVDKQMG